MENQKQAYAIFTVLSHRYGDFPQTDKHVCVQSGKLLVDENTPNIIDSNISIFDLRLYM